ncbi:MAG: hypothetical protein H7Z43_05145 [Clostridia bacterium]|nr:hypothetical protein [Deltaproteobacteria bacterium]
MASGSGINNKGSLSAVAAAATADAAATTGATTSTAALTSTAATTSAAAATRTAATDAPATGAAVVVRNGQVVTASGSIFDLSDPNQVSAARAELGAAGFEELVQAAAAQGLTFNAATGAFASDTVLADKGANKFTDDLGEVDNNTLDEIEQLKKEGININAAALSATAAKLRSEPALTTFNAAVDATRVAHINPSAANVSRAAEFVHTLQLQTGANTMELLFFVFRQSIQSTNEDKKYFLQRLQDFNVMADKLGGYLQDLVADSQQLSDASAGAKYPEKVTVSIEVKKFDLTSLSADGDLRNQPGYPHSQTVDRAGLNDTIKGLESQQEEVRNKRQMASTAFQNFDQKSNQLYNLMASVLKVMNEMRSGTTRNML